MLYHFVGASTNKIITSFVQKPVQYTKHEQSYDSKHFVYVKGISQNNWQEQKVEYFLLCLFDDVLDLNDTDVSEKDFDYHLTKLNEHH